MMESMTVSEMERYLGRDEPPKDFSYFWQKELDYLKSVNVEYDLQPKNFQLSSATCYDLTFTAADTSEIYAKVVFPRNTSPHPVMFKFHGYQGQSSDWSEALKFAAEGVGVVMMDVRGQSGKSVDLSQHHGNTVKGHIIRGVSEGPENIFYKNVYLDIVLLVNIISSFEQVDRTRLFSYGESQGGALALVCAALNPEIKKVFSVYPFLADFRRVLELKYDTEAYDELHRYFKFTDPFYETAETVFETLGYIDVKNFSAQIKAETTMVCCLQDDVCPPSTQYAIFNRLKGIKNMLVLPEYGHEAINVRMSDIVFNWATGKNISG